MHNDHVSVGHSAIPYRLADLAVSGGQHVAHWAQRRLHALGGAVKSMQQARMINVLNGMTDTQLAQVEIKRENIAHEAARMVGMTQNT